MGFFDARIKLPLHLIEFMLIKGVLAISAVRILVINGGRITSRADTMALGMSAKSLVIVLYQLLSGHVKRLQRFSSLRAYLILNAMEVVFWAAVAFLVIQANTQSCTGTSCTLQWVVVALSLVLSVLSVYATVISWFDFRYFKKTGVRRGSKVIRAEYGSAQSLESVPIQERRK